MSESAENDAKLTKLSYWLLDNPEETPERKKTIEELNALLEGEGGEE